MEETKEKTPITGENLLETGEMKDNFQISIPMEKGVESESIEHKILMYKKQDELKELEAPLNRQQRRNLMKQLKLKNDEAGKQALQNAINQIKEQQKNQIEQKYKTAERLLQNKQQEQ